MLGKFFVSDKACVVITELRLPR